ncbi:MAG: homogentisate 1,2-dioxygenase, partial [Pseudolabrys sp.]|nr:homogentisate 1,2-dioxygenase [Pseudolabrys sp.]
MAAAYMSGFGNSFETEALPGALPVGRNSPQKCDYGLYAEQLSGSAFTAPRASNERSWLYRIRPTVRHFGRFERVDKSNIRTAPTREDGNVPIGPMRWSPVPMPQGKLTFVTGLHTITTAGDAETLAGMASHLLFITASMTRDHISNADGEFL